MPSFGKSIALVLILLGWAAVARAVPVDLLKTPVPADVACGGAVDEAATLKAVQHCHPEGRAALGPAVQQRAVRHRQER